MQKVLFVFLTVLALVFGDESTATEEPNEDFTEFCATVGVNCRKCLYDGETKCTWSYDIGERGSCVPDNGEEVELNDDEFDDDDLSDDDGAALAGLRGRLLEEEVVPLEKMRDARNICKERPSEDEIAIP